MSMLDRLNEIFRKVFDDPSLRITDQTTADDVDGWDSFSHANLIVAIETRLQIRFDQKELLSFRNVGDLRRSIEGKLS